mmetsp:Transcript_129/g.314  ORF Transcript_129/g.314 Transcript_129/m.314 type:complete len:323 (-) Transcript_129:150-1118(-)
MDPTLKSVPVIDISPFFGSDAEKRNEVVRSWDRAFSSVGFAVIVGHGIPESVITEAYDVAKGFFGLPVEEKMAYCFGRGYGAGGYTPVGGERVSTTQTEVPARPPDLVENLLVHKRDSDAIPSTPENYKEVMYRYWDHVSTLLRGLMELSAVALDLPQDFFHPSFDSPSCVLRLAHYPHQSTPSGQEGQLRYGEHTDYTGFTILRQDNAPGGLQVRMPDGSWVDVPPVRNSFTINAGDLIQVWTNDRWISNLHRVQNPPPDAEGSTSRTSIVFFTGPNDDFEVTCLPTCQSAEKPAKYAPIKAGEHLWQKLNASSVAIELST